MEGYYVMVIHINLGSILLCTTHDDQKKNSFF